MLWRSTSWQLIGNGDEFTDRMAAAINAMMLDMLAAIARKDYTDRRRRQAQGIEAARKAGKYRGRPEDTKRNADIAVMLREGKSWLTVMRLAKCSRTTVAKVAKRMVESASASVSKEVAVRTVLLPESRHLVSTVDQETFMSALARCCALLASLVPPLSDPCRPAE